MISMGSISSGVVEYKIQLHSCQIEKAFVSSRHLCIMGCNEYLMDFMNVTMNVLR